MMGQVYITNNQHTKEKWLELVKELDDVRFFVNPKLKIFDFIDSIHDLVIDDSKSTYFRARIGEYFTDSELGAPPAKKVLDGRLNPKGIPYLYMAENIDTAISEVRPWIGATVSVAECHVIHKIKVKDFTHDVKKEDMNINDFRMIINKLLSKPINPYNRDLEYLPTQVIAEYIRSKGYDGLRYLSATNNNGINVAVFCPNKVRIKYLEHKKISGIQYHY